jgi:sugar/nucleoside kinase (ribokinase family)
MHVLVIGSAGIQITIPVEKFPLEYKTIQLMDDLVATDVAGVGYSALRILSKLGDELTFLTGIGNDAYAEIIKEQVMSVGAKVLYEVKDKESLISVILYDKEGNRMILREGRMDYKYRMNPEVYQDLGDYDVALVTLAGFSIDILPFIKAKGIPIVTDMQTMNNLTNEFGKPFMEHSDVIFFSNDHFDGDVKKVVEDLYKKYQFEIIGVGLGKEGCLIYADEEFHHITPPKVYVVKTEGAGDT